MTHIHPSRENVLYVRYIFVCIIIYIREIVLCVFLGPFCSALFSTVKYLSIKKYMFMIYIMIILFRERVHVLRAVCASKKPRDIATVLDTREARLPTQSGSLHCSDY